MTLTMTKGKYEEYFFDSEIIKREEKTKTVQSKLPYVTGHSYTNHRTFPKYLKGYENYYTPFGSIYVLKEEYWESRPTYDITVNYEVVTFIPREACLKVINAKITKCEKRIDFLKGLLT